MLHICCRKPCATAATAAAAAALGPTLGSEASLHDEFGKFWILAADPEVFTPDVLTELTAS